MLGIHAFYLFSNAIVQDFATFFLSLCLIQIFYVTIVMHRLEFMRLLGCITYGVIIVTILQHFFGQTIYLFAGGYGCIETNGRERPQGHGGTNGRLEMCCLLVFTMLTCNILASLWKSKHLGCGLAKMCAYVQCMKTSEFTFIFPTQYCCYSG